MRKPARTPRRAAGAKPAAIEALGEAPLVLDGISYRLRPSRAAIAAIEEATGHGLLKLVQLCSGGDLTTEEYGIVAAHLIRAGAGPDDQATQHVGEERIADLIFEAGVFATKAVLTMVLLNAVSGGRTVSGEAKAATA